MVDGRRCKRRGKPSSTKPGGQPMPRGDRSCLWKDGGPTAPAKTFGRCRSVREVRPAPFRCQSQPPGSFLRPDFTSPSHLKSTSIQHTAHGFFTPSAITSQRHFQFALAMKKLGAWKGVLPLPPQLKLKLGPVCRHARNMPTPTELPWLA